MKFLLNVIEKTLIKTAMKKTFFIARAFILVAEGLRSYISVIKYIVIWILEIYIKNWIFFHKVFHKTLVKTRVKEAFFSVFTLYCQGSQFSSRKFDIVKLYKTLHPEMDLGNVYWNWTVLSWLTKASWKQ